MINRHVLLILELPKYLCFTGIALDKTSVAVTKRTLSLTWLFKYPQLTFTK